MAQSFWSRRRDAYDNASSYVRATETVSRPTAILMGMLAVFAVVAVLFGVFWGARLAYSKISGRNNDATSVTTVTDTPKTTITSSTSTTESNAVKTDSTTTNSSSAATSSSSSAASSASQTATQPAKSTSTSTTITNTGPSTIPNTGPTSLVD